MTSMDFISLMKLVLDSRLTLMLSVVFLFFYIFYSIYWN